jgi:plasmid stability protein
MFNVGRSMFSLRLRSFWFLRFFMAIEFRQPAKVSVRLGQNAFTLLSVGVFFCAVKTKATPLTVRGCPAEVHQALKQSAKAKRRSLNGETLAWLEKQAAAEKPVPASKLAAALRRWQKTLSRKDHLEIGERIEEARERMNREHLH